MPPEAHPKYSILTIVSIVTLACYVISAYLYASDVGNNKCLMTYMFEYPQFVVSIFEYYQKIGVLLWIIYPYAFFTHRTNVLHVTHPAYHARNTGAQTAS